MNIEKIIESLLEKKYTERQAPAVAKELSEVDSTLLPLLEAWVNDGTEMNYNVEGYSLLELKSLYKMTYPAALLTIDWLIKEPKTAREAIKRGIR